MTKLKENLRRLMEARGFNQKSLSLAAGKNETLVRDILERGKNPRGDSLSALARVLGCTVSELIGDETPAYPPSNVDLSRTVPVHLPNPADMPLNLPVRGTAAGSNGSGAFQLDVDIVDYVRRPPALMNVPEAYGIYITGESMEPRWFQGDLVFIHPKRPAKPGDFVVIVIQKGEDDPPQTYCKRLLRRHGGVVTVEQYNPPCTLDFPQNQIVSIQKIMENGDLYGI